MVTRFPDNVDLDGVLAKAALINVLYGTNIYDILAVARHIAGLGLDGDLEVGDPSVVDRIRLGHGVVSSGSGKETNFYSFATKYASFHNPAGYAVFDSLVMRLLIDLDGSYAFAIQRLTQKALAHYSTYLESIDVLRNGTGLDYKSFDQGVWLLAKFVYGKKLDPLVLSAIESEIRFG